MTRWIRRTCALLFAVLIAVAGAAVPAAAGGPTSVLLSSPPKVVAVGYDDPRYNQLQRLTEVDLAGGKEAREHATGRFVRALWLIHDMSAWRFDLIYPDADGGPWIATYESANGAATLPTEPVWHRSSDPVALTKLLISLNLATGEFFGGPAGPPNASGPAALPESTPVPTPLPAPASQTIESHQGALSGWRWTIPGIALGALVTYLALRHLPRRRPWELTDVE